MIIFQKSSYNKNRPIIIYYLGGAQNPLSYYYLHSIMNLNTIMSLPTKAFAYQGKANKPLFLFVTAFFVICKGQRERLRQMLLFIEKNRKRKCVASFHGFFWSCLCFFLPHFVVVCHGGDMPHVVALIV